MNQFFRENLLPVFLNDQQVQTGLAVIHFQTYYKFPSNILLHN